MTFSYLALQLQADIDGVVHHSVSWNVHVGGTTRCQIEYRWADAERADDDEGHLRFRVPAKRFRGDATCIICIADERDH